MLAEGLSLDFKSLQVSRTLLSFWTDLNNSVFWMVSAHPLISKSSSPFNNSLTTVTKAPITIGIGVTFMFHSFSIPMHLSLSFNFTLWSAGTASSTILQILFFVVVDYYKAWSSAWDYMIRLYGRIPEKSVCIILQDIYWVVHIPFVRMVKFKFLAQFPVDHFAQPVESSLILFLFKILHSLIMWLMASSLSRLLQQ